MEGTVKWFNRRKGYGFITGDDEQPYFVHFTAVPKDVTLFENDRVSFESVETERGRQAQKVKLLKKGSESKTDGKKTASMDDEQEEQEEMDDEQEEQEEMDDEE